MNTQTNTEKTLIFQGTCMEEALNFSGTIHEIPDSKSHLMGEKQIGEMSDLEKTLYTLSGQKMEKVKFIFNTICGADLSTVPEEEHEKYGKIFEEKITKEQKTEMKKFERESENIKKIMWLMIRMRLPEANEPPTLSLRPGHKIVGGTDVEDIMSGLFGYGISGVMVKVGGF